MEMEIMDQDIDYKLIETEWRASHPRVQESELVRDDPSIVPMLREKIIELEQMRADLIDLINGFISVLARMPENDTWRILTRELVVVGSLGVQLVKTERDMARLNRLIHLDEPLETGGRHISQDVIDRARQIAVIDLVSVYTPVRQTGARHVARCCFHDERSASLTIYPDNGWHCFGCGAHGANAIDFVQKKDNLPFREAVAQLVGAL